MTDQLRQDAQQALEALETCREDEWHSEDDFGMEQTYDEDKVAKALTALRTTLKQPAQQAEPVACRFCHSKKGCGAWQCYECGEIDDVQKPTPPAESPEQEPLEYWNAVEGWVKIDEVREHFDSVGCGTIYKTAGEDRVPLYTTPPQRPWQGLTEEEVQFYIKKHSKLVNAGYDKVTDTNLVAKTFDSTGFYKEVSAALKEKNT